MDITWSGEASSGLKVSAQISVERADLIRTLKHDRLLFDGTQSKISDPDELTARVFYFPTCLAASTFIEIVIGDSQLGLNMSFEEFCTLPPELVDIWMSKAYECNPRWRGPSPTDEKKA